MNKTIAICDLCEMEDPGDPLPVRSLSLPGGEVHVCGPCQGRSGGVRRLLDVIGVSLKAHPIYHPRGAKEEFKAELELAAHAAERAHLIQRLR